MDDAKVRRIIYKDEKFLVNTHAGEFEFSRIGELLSSEEYNEWLEKEKLINPKCLRWKRVGKRKWAWIIDTDKFSKGCYMLFTDAALKEKEPKPNYIGKTKDITTRFGTHCASLDFEKCICLEGKKLHIYFCEETNNCRYGDIEALMIGYNWHKDLYNVFNQ